MEVAMATNSLDPEDDWLASEPTEHQRVSKAEAAKEAPQPDSAQEQERLPLWERIKNIREQLAAYPDTGVVIDKTFYDDLSGEDER
jgi:antitoxin VapB